MFQVSVIIPVYNAEKYLHRAVESAVHLDEVGEIILVEDGSPDNALAICRELEQQYTSIRFLQHPDKKNHGAGASRNLGIREAQFPVIAFLDADDFYLPNRFQRDREILTADGTIDGVYHAMGIHYEDEESRNVFLSTVGAEQEIITLSEEVPPEELIFVWLCEHPTASGCFATNSITVRRSAFDTAGFFNKDLRLQQDTDLFIRLSAVCRLAAGVLDSPVSIRGAHQEQRTTNMELQKKCHNQRLDFQKRWFRRNVRDLNIVRAFNKTYWYHHVRQSTGRKAIYPVARLTMIAGLEEAVKPNGLLDEGLSRIFGSSLLPRYALSAKRRLCGALFRRLCEKRSEEIAPAR